MLPVMLSLQKRKEALGTGNWQVMGPGIHLLSFEIWWPPFLPETNQNLQDNQWLCKAE